MRLILKLARGAGRLGQRQDGLLPVPAAQLLGGFLRRALAFCRRAAWGSVNTDGRLSRHRRRGSLLPRRDGRRLTDVRAGNQKQRQEKSAEVIKRMIHNRDDKREGFGLY